MLLTCTGVTKNFDGVTALSGVSFDLRAGEVHALAGENGAGKSTLMHLLAGVFQPDAGSIAIDGREVHIASERAAQELGIAMVYQERSLFSELNLAENLFVNRQPTNGFGMIDREKLYCNAQVLLNRVGLKEHPATEVRTLSPAKQQMVEIAKALSFRSRIVIFDEPTAALTEAETEKLFQLIAQIKAEGVGVIYISHRLQEIFQIADRVSVLKDGRMQRTWRTDEVTTDELVTAMVGRAHAHERVARMVDRSEAPKLSVRGIRDGLLKDVSFDVYAGEIVGFAGLAGAGRTELALCLFGARQPHGGQITMDGKPVMARSPEKAIAAGVGYVPEDRKIAGLFLDMSIAENISGGSLLPGKKLRDAAAAYAAKLRIAAPNTAARVGKLSGGNQQKVLLARWLRRNPGVLIVDEPSRGVDVGAKAEIHSILRQLSDSGTAVIVISSDLTEVLSVSDRILVMREGRIAGELDGATATEEAVMRLAATSATDRAA